MQTTEASSTHILHHRGRHQASQPPAATTTTKTPSSYSVITTVRDTTGLMAAPESPLKAQHAPLTDAEEFFDQYATVFMYALPESLVPPPTKIETHTGATVLLKHELCQNVSRVTEFLTADVVTYIRCGQAKYMVPPRTHLCVYGPSGVGVATATLCAMAKAGVCNVIVVDTNVYDSKGIVKLVYDRARAISPCVVVFSNTGSMFHPKTAHTRGSRYCEFMACQEALRRDFGGKPVWTLVHTIVSPLSLDRAYYNLLTQRGAVALCTVEENASQRSQYLRNFMRRVALTDCYAAEMDARAWLDVLARYAEISEGCTFHEMHTFLEGAMRYFIRRGTASRSGGDGDAHIFPTCGQLLNYFDKFCNRVTVEGGAAVRSLSTRNNHFHANLDVVNHYTQYLKSAAGSCVFVADEHIVEQLADMPELPFGFNGEAPNSLAGMRAAVESAYTPPVHRPASVPLRCSTTPERAPAGCASSLPRVLSASALTGLIGKRKGPATGTVSAPISRRHPSSFVASGASGDSRHSPRDRHRCRASVSPASRLAGEVADVRISSSTEEVHNRGSSSPADHAKYDPEPNSAPATEDEYDPETNSELPGVIASVRSTGRFCLRASSTLHSCAYSLPIAPAV